MKATKALENAEHAAERAGHHAGKTEKVDGDRKTHAAAAEAWGATAVGWSAYGLVLMIKEVMES